MQAGKVSDLFVLDAGPLDHVRNVRRIHQVLNGGTLVDHEALPHPAGTAVRSRGALAEIAAETQHP